MPAYLLSQSEPIEKVEKKRKQLRQEIEEYDGLGKRYISKVLSGKLNDVPSGRLFRADLGFLQMCQSL